MFKLTRASIFYGDRCIAFDNVDLAKNIPEFIGSAADLDLDGIAEDLNRYVFKRTRTRRKAAQAWELEVGGTDAERARELNEQLAADTQFDGLPRFKETITVTGNGISLYWEAA